MQHRLAVIDAGSFTTPLRNALDALGRLDRADHAALNLALCRLAAGHFEGVRAAVQAAVVAGDGNASARGTLPLIVSRYVAWTGDLHTAAAAWERVRAAVDLLFDAGSAESPVSPAHARLRAATAAELQRTATDVGDVALAAVLHRHARATETAYADANLTANDDVPDDDVITTILDFVHGTLGIQPDATRHRLRMGPRLAAVSTLDVRQIRFGDGDLRIRLTAHAMDGITRYCLAVSQDSGAIPVTLVLEPIVPGRVVRSAVDGTVADLAPRRSVDNATVVPVQLVLDEERRLEIDVEN